MDSTVLILNEFVLAEHGWPPFGGGFDLHAEAAPDLPVAQGVYVIVINDGDLPVILADAVRVIYIGRADGAQGLRDRLRDHRRYGRECRNDTAGAVYCPRYEWVNSAGGLCLFSEVPQGSSVSVKDM